VEFYCILKRMEGVRDELDSAGSESKKRKPDVAEKLMKFRMPQDAGNFLTRSGTVDTL
jgi:hypothetical protein